MLQFLLKLFHYLAQLLTSLLAWLVILSSIYLSPFPLLSLSTFLAPVLKLEVDLYMLFSLSGTFFIFLFVWVNSSLSLEFQIKCQRTLSGFHTPLDYVLTEYTNFNCSTTRASYSICGSSSKMEIQGLNLAGWINLPYSWATILTHGGQVTPKQMKHLSRDTL